MGTATAKMEIFTKGDGIVRNDGWIDLPQQMGRVRLNSEYLAFDPDTLYMEGAHIPDENGQLEDQLMSDSQQFSDEESKDDPMSGQFENSNSEK